MLFTLGLLFAVAGARSAVLPYVLEANDDTMKVFEEKQMWWAKVGNKLVHKPTASTGLSERITDYYYAMGSPEALSEELKGSRVGGEGRLHIFHIPQGLSMLLTESRTQTKDRRSSLSSFKMLESGMSLSNRFPVYLKSSSYVGTLTESGTALERKAVSMISEDDVERYLRVFTGLFSRSYSNATASGEAQDYLVKEFESMGLTVCLQAFERGSVTLNNVVAFVPGRSDDTVTVGAHFDSRPFDGSAPGAEDNGSGVAALLALAKAFASLKIKPTKSVYFTAFAGEEAGMYGSQEFSKQLHEPSATGKIPDACLSKVGRSFLQSKPEHRAIIMDEVGWRTKHPDFPNATVNLESFDWCKDVLEHLAHSSYMHNGDSLTLVHSGTPFGSDHMSWMERNSQAVLTINGDDEAYPHYHQATDTIENVDFALVKQIAKMNLGALLRLSGISEV